MGIGSGGGLDGARSGSIAQLHDPANQAGYLQTRKMNSFPRTVTEIA